MALKTGLDPFKKYVYNFQLNSFLILSIESIDLHLNWIDAKFSLATTYSSLIC
jgi:hypothetical protein